MKILCNIKRIFSGRLLLFLLLVVSFLFLLWGLLSYYLYGHLDYAYFFFKEIYIIILVTLFGFLLVASSNLINTASTAIYYSGAFTIEDSNEEKHENRRRDIVNSTADTCLYLLILFLFSISLWISTLLAIQQENITHFYIFSFLCILLLISFVLLMVYQMYIAADLKEKSAESYKSKLNSSLFA